MSTARFCIKHRVATLLAFIMTMIFGLVFTTQLQMSLLPNMEQPAAMVMCYYSGANPTDMEELITRPLESAAMRVSGVKEVSSTSSNGSCTINITYEDGTDLDIAGTRLREQFDMLTLPEDATKPVIVNMNISELMPAAVVTLQGDDLNQLQSLSEDVVIPALERINGVASVSLSGGTEQEIAVRLDSARAERYGLTNSYLTQFLSAENLLYPGGDLHNGTKTLTVSTDAKYTSLKDVENTLITLPAGGTIRLGEVAQVTLENKERTSLAQMEGKVCVILQVSKQSGSNEAQVSTAVEKRMAALAEQNPSIDYYMAYSAAEYINMAVSSALENIALGVVLAAVVVFLFLRRFGPTMAIVISMPVCILTVFVLMNVFHLTLNMMSLGGIAMGVGMIVDNSIVVLENIYRFIAEGKDRMTACVYGTKEVSNSVIASTLTTVAVFLPLGLTTGIAGMIFKDFCLTIAFLILTSLLIALTLVPLLCYLMLDEEKVRRQSMLPGRKASFFSAIANRLKTGYTKVLAFFARHLFIGMLTCGALVVIFIMTCAGTNMVMMPEMDQGSVSVSVSMPTGSSVEETVGIAEQVCAVAEQKVPERETCYYIVSNGGSASVGLNLVNKQERTRSAAQIADDLRSELQDIAGCEISVSTQEMSVSNAADINVVISGENHETLAMLADDLAARIGALPDAVDVKSSMAERVPQVKVTMNRQVASQYGLTAAQVGAAVRSELSGATATKVTIDNTELNVVIKGDGEASRSLDALRSMKITTATGGSVPLSSVAHVDVVQAPQSVIRHNQSRQVTVSGTTRSGNATAITQQINEILDSYPMPQGYTIQTDGSYEDMTENFSSLGLALLVALGLVYFVLAAQFNSFLMPVIVMLILPVAFSGALFALPITGREISMISFVSLIMLAGTVVNSSIILVDYINIRREGGESRQEAIVHACALRVRPVLMTTLTTVLAMIPMAMGLGDTNEMMSDMGITMMSGMIISTVVTLLFTPVFYSVIDNLAHVFSKRKKKKSAPAEA